MSSSGFILFIILCTPAIFALSPMFKLVHERAELVSYDAGSVDGEPEFRFAKFNRSNFALNVSYLVNRDFDDNIVQIDVTSQTVPCSVLVDKLFGTEYKRTGTKVVMNLCKFWKSNLFGMKETISQHGNLTACNVKRGFYVLKNYLPNDDFFPRYLPFGSYRIIIGIDDKQRNVNLFTLKWFARVEQVTKH